MNTKFAISPLAAAVALAISGMSSAQAQSVEELIRPDSSLSVQVLMTGDDNQSAGMYTGQEEKGTDIGVGIDLIQREDETGRWVRLKARNLGMPTPEFRVEHELQGDWRYFLDYSRMVRMSPLAVSATLTGVGSATQNATGGAASNLDLNTERDVVKLGFEKQLPSRLSVSVNYSQDEKDADRAFGWRSSGSNIFFFAEPIDSTTRQVDVALGYTGDKLQLSGGYYGTSFSNREGVLNVSSTTPAASGQVALPPDTQSHQLYVKGGYSFTKDTRATFKVSSAKATQDENFFTPNTQNLRTDLDGEVDTTLVQLGVTSRPMPKLTVLADLRYEDRDDNTPVDLYIDTAAGVNDDRYNVPHSRTTTTGKVEASYALPLDLRVTAGVDVEKRKRSVPASYRQISFREETDETTYRVQLSRMLSETINGSISYLQADRDGSDYFNIGNLLAGAGTVGVIDPLHMADRKRDKVRLALDWMPTESLSVQLMAESSKDEYDGRALGPREGEARLVSLDASYAINDEWQVTGWISRDETKADQRTTGSANTTPATPTQDWFANLKQTGDSFGLGVRGEVTDRVKVGANLQYAHDRAEHAIQLTTGTTATIELPPNLFYKTASANLFLSYDLADNSGVRFDYIQNRVKTDDWTWSGTATNPWTYTGGTTVAQTPDEKVEFFGMTYYYRWQ